MLICRLRGRNNIANLEICLSAMRQKCTMFSICSAAKLVW